MVEAELFELLRFGANLRVNELEFIPSGDHKRRSRFRTDANPVDPRWRLKGAIGLDSNLDLKRMQRIDEGFINLQQWLAPRQDCEWSR